MDPSMRAFAATVTPALHGEQPCKNLAGHAPRICMAAKENRRSEQSLRRCDKEKGLADKYLLTLLLTGGEGGILPISP
jgi:hypothetical protein